MRINIAGSTITQFGELWGRSLRDLLFEAMEQAIISAQLEPSAIEAVFVANKAGGSLAQQRHLNALASSWFPHFPPALRVEAACASGGLAMIAAEDALLSQRFQTVLVVGVEKMTDVPVGEVTEVLATAADMEQEIGSTFPALYALLANAHIQAFGTTREQLSTVAVKNHAHAIDNPVAQFRKAVSMEQVSHSALVADPLRVLDCSPITDGAAAVVLSTHSPQKKSTKPCILGRGHAQDTVDLASRASLTELAATKRAAAQAYAQAHLTPKDLPVAEVHDCFTIAEILAIEDLGFVAKGEGGPATLRQDTTYQGKIVINPSGGLKACGHPVGATGVKQVAYLAQLIEQNLYPLALAHNVGGSGGTAVVHILGKESA